MSVSIAHSLGLCRAYILPDRSFPCDTPLSPVSRLAASNGGIFAHLDFSTLSPDYASKTGIFAPEKIVERAKRVRRWLRDRPEVEIVGMSDRLNSSRGEVDVSSGRTRGHLEGRRGWPGLLARE